MMSTSYQQIHHSSPALVNQVLECKAYHAYIYYLFICDSDSWVLQSSASVPSQQRSSTNRWPALARPSMFRWLATSDLRRTLLTPTKMGVSLVSVARASASVLGSQAEENTWCLRPPVEGAFCEHLTVASRLGFSAISSFNGWAESTVYDWVVFVFSGFQCWCLWLLHGFHAGVNIFAAAGRGTTARWMNHLPIPPCC